MTTELSPINEKAPDMLAVQTRWTQLLALAKERDLTPAETSEAITCNRILRRTNTGPARAKAPGKRAQKEAKTAAITKALLED